MTLTTPRATLGMTGRESSWPVRRQLAGSARGSITYRLASVLLRAAARARAQELEQLEPGSEEMAMHSGNLGVCYKTLGDLPKAIAHHERALALNEKLGLLKGQAIQSGHLGDCYLTLGNSGKAVELLERALELYRRMTLPEDHSYVSWTRSKLEDAKKSGGGRG